MKQPVSYYFALGDSERWTVRITPELCEVYPGKVINPADCVLKTSPEMQQLIAEAFNDLFAKHGKPEIAPQAIVMKTIGKIGNFSGFTC